MTQEIFSAVLGFILGIVVTVLTGRSWRYLRAVEARRKGKVGHLQVVREWMDSYQALFNGIYPECPELILAHKMLSPKYPHYDETAPARLYEALKEYRDLRARHEELTRRAKTALEALADKNLDRLFGLNQAVTGLLKKLRLFRGEYLLPVSFPRSLDSHLKLIDDYQEKVFEAFPRKFIQKIDWDKLDLIDPQELASIIRPRLKYYKGDEATTAHRETESRRFDEMQNLSFYRIVAKKEIEQVLLKIQGQEELYSKP